MRNIPFSINSWIFGQMPIEKVVERAKRIGVQGLDISGEPDTSDVVRNRKALERSGLVPYVVNGNFLSESRAFNHSNPAYRRSAVKYGKKCVEMAVALGADKVLIVPSLVNHLAYFESREADWRHAVEGVRETAEYAAERRVTILLECVNKYEVNLVHTLRDGIRMAEDIGCNNVRLVADTFHMQMEEEWGNANAIRQAGKWVGHVHVGDNTREVPGKGCMDWRELFIALEDIGYTGAVSFEPLPQRLTPEEIFAGKLDLDLLTADLQFSHAFLEHIAAGI